LRGGVHLEQGYVNDVCLTPRFNQCVFYEDELTASNAARRLTLPTAMTSLSYAEAVAAIGARGRFGIRLGSAGRERSCARSAIRSWPSAARSSPERTARAVCWRWRARLCARPATASARRRSRTS
jgi:hypothetical protein